MQRLTIPTTLAEFVPRWGEGGERWLAELPGLVGRLGAAWSLEVGEPYQPGGQCSWVAPARRTTDDARLALKVGWRHPEAEHEAAGLRAWDGNGTARVFEAWAGERASVLLLERCEPGTPLRAVLPEPEQDVVVAGLLRRLWIDPPAAHPFASLATLCASWASECEARLERWAPPDPGLVRDGLALWRSLPESADRRVLLATDLHGENILRARREPWLAIDPKPYVGDPAYDPMQHLLNCPGRLASDPGSLCDRMAGLTGVDPGRLRLWTFARLVVDSEGPGGVGWAAENLERARRLAP